MINYDSIFFWLIVIAILSLMYWIFLFLKPIKDRPPAYFKKVENRSKVFELQYKRLALIVLLFVLVFLISDVYEYQKNNKGYYLKELTAPNAFLTAGYSSSTLELQLKEIFEEGQDMGFENLTSSRQALKDLTGVRKDSLNIDFDVQGLGFSLRGMARAIGQVLFGDQRKAISINIINDESRLRSMVSISGSPIRIFDEYFENSFNRDMTIRALLQKTEYYIMEIVEPVTMSVNYYHQGKFSKALNLLYKMLNSGNRDYEVYSKLTYILHKSQSLHQETRCLDTAMNYFPDDLGFMCRYASNRITHKKYTEGDAILNKVLLREPFHFYGNVSKASLLYRFGMTDSAIHHFQMAIWHNDPRERNAQMDFLTALSRSFMKKGMLDSSEFYFFKAMQFDPESLDAFTDGHYYFLLDSSRYPNQESMRQVWQDLNKKSGEYMPALYFLGQDYMNRGMYKDGAELLKQCLRKYPRFDNAQILLSVAYLRQGHIQEADSVINIVLTRYTSNSQALYYKAMISGEKGDPEDAKIYYNECLKYDPYARNAIEKLILLDYSRGDHDVVVSNLYKYLELYKTDPIMNYILGLEYYIKLKYAKSAYHMQVAWKNGIGNYPEYAPVCFKLAGISNFYLQNDNDAIKQLETYTKYMNSRKMAPEQEALSKLRLLYDKYGMYPPVPSRTGMQDLK